MMILTKNTFFVFVNFIATITLFKFFFTFSYSSHTQLKVYSISDIFNIDLSRENYDILFQI